MSNKQQVLLLREISLAPKNSSSLDDIKEDLLKSEGQIERGSCLLVPITIHQLNIK